MTPGERLVWAAAFAEHFARVRELGDTVGDRAQAASIWACRTVDALAVAGGPYTERVEERLAEMLRGDEVARLTECTQRQAIEITELTRVVHDQAEAIADNDRYRAATDVERVLVDMLAEMADKSELWAHFKIRSFIEMRIQRNLRDK